MGSVCLAGHVSVGGQAPPAPRSALRCRLSGRAVGRGEGGSFSSPHPCTTSTEPDGVATCSFRKGRGPLPPLFVPKGKARQGNQKPLPTGPRGFLCVLRVCVFSSEPCLRGSLKHRRRVPESPEDEEGLNARSVDSATKQNCAGCGSSFLKLLLVEAQSFG